MTRAEQHGTGTATVWQIVGVSLLAAVCLFGYGLVRSPVESLFIDRAGADSLPLVWVVVAVLAGSVVVLYERAARHYSLGALLVASLLISGGALAGLAVAVGAHSPAAHYALYAWRDVYVIVLIEIIWSMANVALEYSTARWAYGLFCAAGSVGGITGNLLASDLAGRLGSTEALWVPVPLFLLAAAVGMVVARTLATTDRPPRTALRLSGLTMVLRSPYLRLILTLVVISQLVTTLIDFTFNTTVESLFTDLDERTRAIGLVYASVDGVSLVLQLLTAALLTAFGTIRLLWAVPLVLIAPVVSFAAIPVFAVVAVLKVTNKSLDYSIFRAAKETLYLPLSYGEKARGKAVIDMFAYRAAKVGASLALVALAAVGVGGSQLAGVAAGLCALWLALTGRLSRLYRQLSGPGARLHDGR